MLRTPVSFPCSVCVCACTHTRMCLSVCIWKSEVDLDCLPVLVNPLFLRQSFFGCIGWPMSFRGLPVFASPVLWLWMHSTAPSFLHGCWGVRLMSSCLHNRRFPRATSSALICDLGLLGHHLSGHDFIFEMKRLASGTSRLT